MIGIIGSGAGGVALSKYFEDRGIKTIVWFHSPGKYRLFRSQNNAIISKEITGDSISHGSIITDENDNVTSKDIKNINETRETNEINDIRDAIKNSEVRKNTDAPDSNSITDSTETAINKVKNDDNKNNNREAHRKYSITTITRITDSLEELIESARYIFIVTPARVHEEIAFQLEDLLDPDYHVLILYPGRTYGSLAFYNSMRFNFDNIFEAQTILHACRLENII